MVIYMGVTFAASLVLSLKRKVHWYFSSSPFKFTQLWGNNLEILVSPTRSWSSTYTACRRSSQNFAWLFTFFDPSHSCRPKCWSKSPNWAAILPSVLLSSSSVKIFKSISPPCWSMAATNINSLSHLIDSRTLRPNITLQVSLLRTSHATLRRTRFEERLILSWASDFIYLLDRAHPLPHIVLYILGYRESFHLVAQFINFEKDLQRQFIFIESFVSKYFARDLLICTWSTE